MRTTGGRLAGSLASRGSSREGGQTGNESRIQT